MKWILLIGVTLLTTGCIYTTTEIVENRQVMVAPVFEPVILYDTVPANLDVTTTTIDYF